MNSMLTTQIKTENEYQVDLLVPFLGHYKELVLEGQEVLVIRGVQGNQLQECQGRIRNFGWGKEIRKGQVLQHTAFHMEIHMRL